MNSTGVASRKHKVPKAAKRMRVMDVTGFGASIEVVELVN